MFNSIDSKKSSCCLVFRYIQSISSMVVSNASLEAVLNEIAYIYRYQDCVFNANFNDYATTKFESGTVTWRPQSQPRVGLEVEFFEVGVQLNHSITYISNVLKLAMTISKSIRKSDFNFKKKFLLLLHWRTGH